MLKSYINRVSKEAELDEALSEEPNETWSFFLSPTLSMTIKKEEDLILFSCDLGPAPKQPKQLEEMLHANLSAVGTLGGSLALDLSLQKARLWRSILADAGYECFKNALEDFANCAEYWSGFVRGEKQNSL